MSKKESLTCEICSSSWTRKKTRGRKPKVCPQCIKDNVVLSEEVTYMPSNTSSKKAIKWTCPLCTRELIMFINLKYPPICNNPDSHTSKKVEMQITARKEKIVS